MKLVYGQQIKYGLNSQVTLSHQNWVGAHTIGQELLYDHLTMQQYSHQAETL